MFDQKTQKKNLTALSYQTKRLVKVNCTAIFLDRVITEFHAFLPSNCKKYYHRHVIGMVMVMIKPTTQTTTKKQ